MRTTCAAVAAALTLAGCGNSTATASATEFARNFAGYSADYELAESPAALATRATVVVQGHIARINKGRIQGTSAADPGSAPQLVMAVSVKRVLRGTLSADAGGVVYVELPAPAGVRAAVVDRSAPKASDAMLYLVRAPSATDLPIVDPDAGRPVGQVLYQPVSPQGFVVAAGPDVVQILNFARFAGADIADFAPDAIRFP
jgi:hypothetical protein